MQAWALNRYYYQSRIPMKDCALMARITDPELRREWSQRVIDHDGTREGQGGIARWLTALRRGRPRRGAWCRREEGILPATRFAVDAYVRFVSEKSLLEAIASSLTELFAPGIIRERVTGMLAGYDFIDEETLSYFRPRLDQAPRDAEFALAYVKEHATTPERAPESLRGAALQVRCAVVAARRAAPRLCARRRHPARLLRAGRGGERSGEGGMSALTAETVLVRPTWARLKHCDVRDAWLLLVPERVLFPLPDHDRHPAAAGDAARARRARRRPRATNTTRRRT